MPTTNPTITSAWTKIADNTDPELLASWREAVTLEVATTLTNAAPSAGFGGHRLHRGGVLTRRMVGAGYVWAKLADSNSYPASIALAVSKNGLADQGPTTVGGKAVLTSALLTRPADTVAYAALDTLANSTSAPVVLTFAGMARIAGGSGRIAKARMETNQSSNVARFRLHLFSVAPTALNDNVPYTLLWANRDKRVGTLDFPAAVTEGTGSDAARAHVFDARIDYVCAAADTALYGLLETLDAFTPASAQQIYLELIGSQN